MGQGLRRTAFDRSSYDYWTGRYNTINVKDFGAVGDGVHDDTAAIQAAFDAMGSQPTGTLYFPPGTYRTSKTLDFNLGHLKASYDGTPQAIAGAFAVRMDGVVAPKAGIGAAFFVYSGYYPKLQIRGYGGGQSGDMLLKAEDLLGPTFFVEGHKYGGTVFYTDGTGIPNSGGDTLRCTLVNGGRIIAEQCGQAFYIANYGGFGVIDSVWDDGPAQASEINNAGDVTILHYENSVYGTAPIGNTTFLLNAAYSIHLAKLALGTNIAVQSLVRVQSCNLYGFNTGITIDEFFGQGGGNAGMGLWSVNSGVSIANAQTLTCTQYGIEQDGGVVSIGYHRDSGSKCGFGISNFLTGTSGVTSIGGANYYSMTDAGILVGTGCVGGQLTINDMIVQASSTPIQVLSTDLQVAVRGFVDASGSGKYSIQIPKYSQLFSSPWDNILPKGIHYSSAGPILPATPLVSGTVYRNTNLLSITIYQPAYASTAGTAGSVAVALGSSDTPSTLYTQWVNGSTTSSLPDVLAPLRVPPNWTYSFTTSGATLADANIQGE